MDDSWVEIFTDENRGVDELIIFCCCQQKIRIAPSDRWALCPHCQQRLALVTGPAQRADAYRRQGRRQESWTIDNHDYQLSLPAHSEITAGSLLTVVYRAGIGGQQKSGVGVTDHSRHIWFRAQQDSTDRRAIVWGLALIATVLAAGYLIFLAARGLGV